MKKALKVGSLSAAGGIVLVAIVGFIMYSTTSVPTQAAADVTMQNSTVYYNDGKTLVGSFGNMHRQDLNFNQIPKSTQDAVLAAEERGFWTDAPVSPTGMLRAAYDDMMSSGGSLSGGSTITQEFVRNYYADVGTQQTASRKIKEIFIAMKLGQSKSKQWILTNYLNTIYLGEDSYGVGAAAETYFGEPAQKLTTAQSAVLAAIIQQPSTYPLQQYRPQLIARWHYVLNGMVKMHDLTQAQADSMKFPAMLPAGSQYSGSKPWTGYVMQEVQDELKAYDHITPQQLDSGGYRINLTISQKDEQALYESVNNNIAKIKASGDTIPPWALIGAQAENPANGAIEAIYGGAGQDQPQAQCSQDFCYENTTLNGEQVGSSFKPYTLSAAVKQGMNVKSSLLNGNSPLWVPPFGSGTTMSSTKPMPANSGYHKFTNDDNEELGAADVQTALAKSSNTAFTDLAHRVGLKPIEQMAEAMGGVDPNAFKGEYGVGITLGQDSLTVNDQASMVATIDDGGVYHQAHLIGSYSNATDGTKKQPVKTDVALSKAEDSQVQYAMLKTDSAEGTAPAAAMTDGRPVISKTGTTTGSKSAFYIGAIPQDVLAVGIYTAQQSDTDNNQTLTGLGGGGFGGSWPASIWHDYAESQWANMPITNFPNPVFSGTAWLQVPKPKPKPKPKATPKPSVTPSASKPCQQGGGGLFGNGNCQPSTGPSTAPATPTPTAPSQCSGLFGCPSTAPASSAPATSGSGGGNKPGG